MKTSYATRIAPGVYRRLLVPTLITGLLLLTGSASGGENDSISAIQPSEIPFGKETPVTVLLKNNIPSDAAFTLRPAAPFALRELRLPGAAKHLSKHDQVMFVATNDNNILAVDFNKTVPHVIHKTALNAPITAMHMANGRLIVATGHNELLVYNITPDNTLQQMQRHSFNQTISAIEAHESNVYVLFDNNLRILQLTPKTKTLATIALQNRFNDFTVKGRYCYLTGIDIGLQILDINNPAKAKVLDTFKIPGIGYDVEVVGTLAYIAGGQSGMVIFDTSNPSQIQWLGSHSKLGAIYEVSVHEGMGTAIINDDNYRLASLSVDNALLPITDSFYKSRASINDTLLDWPYVYIASDMGVEQVDFSISAASQISNEGINHGGSRRAFIRDNIAYVADWFSGLHLYDISIPHAPRHLGNFHTPGSSKGVVLKDHYAFVGDDDHGLQVIDIKDPQNPKKVSEVLSTGLAYTMKLVDNTIYLADHRGGFHIIDIADISQPKIVGSYDTPSKSWAIDVVDNIAYVADDASGLLVFDVSNPQNIRQIGQFDPGGYAEDVKVIGKHAYVAFFDKGFYILDISNPRDPQPLGHTPIPGNARSVTIEGAYAYIAGWESGLQVVDIRKLSAPQIVAHYDTDGSAWGLDIYKGYAYVWDWWGGIKVFNVSNPTQPRAVGQYHAKGIVKRLTIAGNYIYTANGSGGMQVYDIKNPLNPIWTTGLDVSANVYDVAVANHKAYLALGDGGIVIADVANPFYTRWLARLPTPGKINRIVANDNTIAAIDEHAGLLIIDAVNPLKPAIKLQQPMEINDLWLQNQYLYITSPSLGLLVYEISENKLNQIVRYQTQQTALWVRSSGKFVYLYESNTGIRVFTMNGNTLTPVGVFAISAPIEDLQFFQDQLYIACKHTGLISINMSDPANPTATTIYPDTGVLGPFAINSTAVFFAGGKTINSVTRLPGITLNRISQQKLKLTIPATMPLGDYQLSLLQPTGDTWVMEQTITVKPQKRKKPKFTMEQFKKILQQQKLNKQNPENVK